MAMADHEVHQQLSALESKKTNFMSKRLDGLEGP
jgi:hypothetical protein